MINVQLTSIHTNSPTVWDEKVNVEVTGHICPIRLDT